LHELKHDVPSGKKKSKPWFYNLNADGIVVRDLENIEEIVSMRIPIIVASTVKSSKFNLPYVCADNEKVGMMGAEHFIERGFQEFGFYGFNDMQWSLNRYAGFSQRLAVDGFEVQTYLWPRLKDQRVWEKEQKRTTDWLKSLPKPVGIMACSDYEGQKLIEVCKTADIRVPEEVAILGANNNNLVCSLCFPPLSSIEINYEYAGYQAAELLEKLMDGEKMESQKIIANPTRIVTRHSTDILAVKDNELANALRFIREHCMEPIRISDVLNSTSLSQRVLHDRFKKIVGRSVHTEIRRVRCQKIGQLLLETNLTISQIAAKMCYYDDRHMCRYFKNETGLSPREFRKQRGHQNG